MNYQQAINAINEAKAVYCFCFITPHEGDYLKVSKGHLKWLLTQHYSERDDIQARWGQVERDTLFIN